MGSDDIILIHFDHETTYNSIFFLCSIFALYRIGFLGTYWKFYKLKCDNKIWYDLKYEDDSNTIIASNDNINNNNHNHNHNHNHNNNNYPPNAPAVVVEFNSEYGKDFLD